MNSTRGLHEQWLSYRKDGKPTLQRWDSEVASDPCFPICPNSLWFENGTVQVTCTRLQGHAGRCAGSAEINGLKWAYSWGTRPDGLLKWERKVLS